MNGAQGRSCHACGGPLTYVAMYSRYFCPRCQKYMPQEGVGAQGATGAAPTVGSQSEASPRSPIQAQHRQQTQPQQSNQPPQHQPMYQAYQQPPGPPPQAYPPPYQANQQSPYQAYHQYPYQAHQQPYYAPPPPLMGGGPWPTGFQAPTEESGRIYVEAAVAERAASDVQLSTGWVWAFLGVEIATLAFTFVWLFTYLQDITPQLTFQGSAPFVVGLFAFMVAASAIQAVLVYRLVRMRDAHVARDRRLREGVLQYLSARNSANGGAAGMDVATLGFINASARVEEEGERGAVLWGLLAFIPVVNMVVMPILLYGMTKDMARHSQRQDYFMYHAQMALARLGRWVQHAPAPRGPERSAALYVVLYIFTGSLFLFYWLYVSVVDWNAHFAGQHGSEDTLLAALRG
jgi:hypothetical protein